MPSARGNQTDVESVVESEWRRLRRQYELAEGFWLGFIFCPSPRSVAVLRRRVGRMFWFRGLMSIRPTSPTELRDVLPRLLDTKAAGARCVWVEAVHLDSVTPRASTKEDPGPWAAAWDWLMMRANEHRDALRRHLTGGLVFAVPDEWKPRVRDAAPDLWSVRSVVLDVPGRVLSGGTAPSRGGGLAGYADVFDADVDVDFALAEVRRTRQTQRYSRQSRVPLLLRASEGLLAGGRTAEASEVAREAVELLRSEQRPEDVSQEPLAEGSDVGRVCRMD